MEPGSGFYLEDTVSTAGDQVANGAANGASRGLFVAIEGSSAAAAGNHVAVDGRVAETGSARDTLTALVDATVTAICAEALALPLTEVSLPLDSRQREALESVRVAFAGDLVLTDHYNLHRGEATLAAGAPLRIPTEDAAPGVKSARSASGNRARELPIALPGPDHPALPIGARVVGLLGVMGHDGRAQRLLLESTPQAPAVNIPLDPPPAEPYRRIVSANLLNYFNGDGRGGGFPTERGAQTQREFAAQRDRTRAALARIRPHLLAVQELENDGFGPDSAARSLLDLLNETGDGDWAVVDPGSGRIGGDLITVGLFYRQHVFEPVGAPAILQGAAFERRSRQPLAQRFRDRASGEEFVVAVNHLKSKGRCPESGPDSDQGDGQGCWNRARVEAVSALAPWLAELGRGWAAERVLILGDMNAWRLEDPIRAFREAGYVELVEARSGLPQHSFLYFGQRGTLDYAFASPALAQAARRAFIWHSNADWPGGMPLSQPWLRMSDHDPVIVDLEFSQAATSD
ncbi:MAG: ExeM/NucH family extracellular endonuclease [Xanthomonadales bacterium]|nr:ExeM/NucH family extracellular endonuclease [Xanthomonadales bacterium]